ncbi:MAG: T9SS type A sorting domain-containing protein, partial [Saprospiraceae bacterium]|nr:T9SS type A sorting domain-containing protein [Saprospiraceae bacterium]
GNKRRIDFGTALTNGQSEGVGFSGNRTGYITNERTLAGNITLVSESVRSFDISEWVPESVGAGEPLAQKSFRVFPNPVSQNIHFQFFENEKPRRLLVSNLLGQEVLRLNEVPETLDMSHFLPGIYSFEMIWDDRTYGLKVVKQ